VYSGELKLPDEEKLGVFKKITDLNNDQYFSSLLGRFDIRLVDLASFNDVKMQNLSFIQEKPFGYLLYYDLKNGQITISENTNKWPSKIINCQEFDKRSIDQEMCILKKQYKFDTIPSDDLLIKIADRFLKDHHIEIGRFGVPFVDKEDFIGKISGSEFKKISNEISVVYPFIVDGKPIVDQSGQKMGLQLFINLKHHRVAKVNNLSIQKYEKSLYRINKNIAEILKSAEKGGLNQMVTSPGLKQVVEVYLADPEIGYAQLFNNNEELMIPVLIFPVRSSLESEGIPKTIMVPLVQDSGLQKEDSTFPVAL